MPRKEWEKSSVQWESLTMTSEIDKIRELLPLYVNGSLFKKQIAEVEAALEEHPELQEVLLDFEAIGKAYQSMEKETPALSNRVYPKILNNIRPQVENNGWLMIRNLIRPTGEFFTWMFGSPKVAWGFAAVQLVIIVVLIAGNVFDRKYVTLTTPSVFSNGASMVQVVFVDSATEGEIRELLIKLNIVIKGGPTPEGVYTIMIQKGSDPSSIVETLKKSPLVRFAARAY